eukprot:ANDGO_03767.mRNA.1 Kinesin-associated protein 3
MSQTLPSSSASAAAPAATREKKKVRVGRIEADANELAILVNFQVETTTFDANDRKIDCKVKEGHKTISLVRELDEYTDISALAKKLVASSRFLDSSKLNSIEDVIYVLQRRISQRSSQQQNKQPPSSSQQQQYRNSVDYNSQNVDGSDVSINNLSEYMEALYSVDIKEKTVGSAKIALLSKQPAALELLATNESLMNLLSRELREEGKKSYDYLMNLLYVFYAMAHFSQFHPIITQHKVGAVVMSMVELEMKRWSVRDKDAERKEIAPLQNTLLTIAFSILLNLAEDIAIERKMRNKNLVFYLCSVLQRTYLSAELLTVTLTFLKKLSIFAENKDEMREHEVAQRLSALFGTAKKALNEVSMDRLIRLMINLSFDPSFRTQFLDGGVVPRLVALLQKSQHLQIVLRLLYQFTLDENCRSMFLYSDGLSAVMDLLLNYPEVDPQSGDWLHMNRELVALTVNLASNVRNAEAMSGFPVPMHVQQNYQNASGRSTAVTGLDVMVQRSLRTQDPLLMKAVRNFSMHDSVKKRLAMYAHDFGACVAQFANADIDEASDFLVEVLGTLANLNLQSIDFSGMIVRYHLIEFMTKNLVPGYAEDDVVLEIVILIGTMMHDEKCADLVSKSALVHSLCDLLVDKQEDDEMVLQISYVFFALVTKPIARSALLRHPHIIPYLVELLYDSNEEIRKMTDQTLDVILETNDEWAAIVRQKKFDYYNSTWQESIDGEEVHDMDSYQSSYAAESHLLAMQGRMGGSIVRPSSKGSGNLAAPPASNGSAIPSRYRSEDFKSNDDFDNWHISDQDVYSPGFYGNNASRHDDDDLDMDDSRSDGLDGSDG